jgi:hypothetical protein
VNSHPNITAVRRGCSGRVYAVNNERDMHRHHKYLETLFSIDHACEQLMVNKKSKLQTKNEYMDALSKYDVTTYEKLHHVAKRELHKNAYNFIGSGFWNGLFPISSRSITKQ